MPRIMPQKYLEEWPEEGREECAEECPEEEQCAIEPGQRGEGSEGSCKAAPGDTREIERTIQYLLLCVWRVTAR